MAQQDLVAGSAARKKRKITHNFTRDMPRTPSAAEGVLNVFKGIAPLHGSVQPVASTSALKVEETKGTGEVKNGESVDELRKMILSKSVVAAGGKGYV